MVEIEQSTCTQCGNPIEQKLIGPIKREYCSDRCRQKAYRERERERKVKASHRNVTVDAETQQRITELERENKELQARLDLEERFRTDIEVRTFKSWLRTHPQPRDTDFAKRFLDDRDMPLKASRAKYEAIMRASGSYSQVDIELFKDAWKTLMASTLELAILK